MTRAPEVELAVLRLSLRRIAQSTKDPEILAAIPNDYADRGWNRLAAMVCDWVEGRYESP